MNVLKKVLSRHHDEKARILKSTNLKQNVNNYEIMK